MYKMSKKLIFRLNQIKKSSVQKCKMSDIHPSRDGRFVGWGPGWLVGFWCTHFRDLAPLINSVV